MTARAPLLWVALVGVMAFGMFQLKLAVQDLEDTLARVNRDLLASEESIHVLRAEWSYLNQPERLAGLAERHLNLEFMAPEQLGAIASLPLRMGGGGDESGAPAVHAALYLNAVASP